MSVFICGGVISQSQHDKNVMDDKHFKEYEILVNSGEDKKAEKIFKKFAISQI